MKGVSLPFVATTARELLTRIPTSDGSPLFKNALDLGRQIAQIAPHPHETTVAVLLNDPGRNSNRYFNRPKQAGNFLNMVLGGVKPCPTSLRELIAVCIRNRLGPDRVVEAESWITRVNAALSEQHAAEREAKLGGSQAHAVTQFLEDSTEILIARPASHDEFELRADKVLNHCFDRLGLGRRQTDLEPLKVTICLPSAESAEKEADVLLRVMRSRFANANSPNKRTLETNFDRLVEGNILRVIHSKRASTMIPFVAFQLSDPDRMAAFCYTVDRSGKSGFLQLPRASCFEIQISFLSELKEGPQNVLQTLNEPGA